ncbi:MAG TPA: hypothetical protein VG844_14050 [Terracidiphilus sp.]|nr:hypothetical protein [Terracidiphilus sp.]
MKKLLIVACVLGFAGLLHAQATDTTVCDILKNPAAFNNKIVKIKGTVSAGFDSFIVQAPKCGHQVDGIWLQYPEGAKVKSGPDAVITIQPARNFAGTFTPAPARTPVTLSVDKEFKKFDSSLADRMHTNGACLGCARNLVAATLVGRIDAVKPELHRDASGKITAITGFGNLNRYPVRLVLQSVADVDSQRIDVDKDSALKPTASEADASQRVSQSFASAIAFNDHPKRAADAFGKQGDNNGVVVAFTQPGVEASALEAQSTSDSPDGVIFDVLINSDHVKKEAMPLAIAHLGEHIADFRTPESTLEDAVLYQYEYRAWITTMLTAMKTGEKSIQIPGGYTLWSASANQADLNANTDMALTAFFADQACLSR